MNNLTYEGQFDTTDIKWVELSASERAKLSLVRGDLLFNRTNSRELVGKTGVWNGPDNFTFAGYLIRVRLREDRVLPGWISAFMNSPTGKTALFHMAKPSINMANISATDLLRLEVPIAPLEHQRRAIAQLEKADAIRRKRKEAIALTEELLRSAFLEMFGDPVTNPKGWPVTTLGEQAEQMKYGTSKKCDANSELGQPVLRIPNVVGGEIDWDDLKHVSLDANEASSLRLQKGDILFVRSNGNPAYIGRCAVYNSEKDALFASYLIRVRVDTTQIDPNYVQAALSSNSYRSLLTSEARTTAGNYNISTEGLRRLRLPLPPITRQRRFTAFTNSVLRSRAALVSAAAAADTLFTSLVDRGFRGELSTSKRGHQQLRLLEDLTP